MVLSPTQVDLFHQCPAKYYFKKVRKLADVATSSQSVGTAVHFPILDVNFRQKIRTGVDLPVEELKDICAESWAKLAQETRFDSDEDPAELGMLAEACVEEYMRTAAPRIQPALVEHLVEGEIAGIKVKARIDLVDVDGLIIDIKTAADKPQRITQAQKLQLGTYDLLCPESRGNIRVDTLVKGRGANSEIRLIQLPHTMGPSDVQYVETIYSLTQDSIRDQIFYPRRDHYKNTLCSRSKCPFWKACEQEYGGEVEP
jgi:CRISPR/Cas system-associated exonuclease Cas4 (RecB family)